MSDSLSQPSCLPYFIKYNPQLISEFGSQNAVLLFDRLEYWFAKKKDQFYKFIEPCEHPCYREGDSWCEELGFSRPIFRTAFDKIGTRYRSKTEFLKEKEPFKGKLFAYYQDSKSNKTIFVRNNSLLAELYARLKNLLQKTVKAIKPSVSRPIAPFQPRAETIRQPYVRAAKDKQINTSFKKNEKMIFEENLSPTEIGNEHSQRAQEIKDIWVDEIGSRGLVKLTPESMERLVRDLNETFQGSLDKWRAHCQKIASSSFLMGEKEGTNYEIRILVALTQKFKDQLADGKFELNTRETRQDQKIKESTENLKKIALQKELIENQIENLEREKKSHEKKLISERVGGLSPAELQAFKDQYESQIATSSCSQGQFFRQEGWEGKMVNIMFDLFVRKQIESSLPQKDWSHVDNQISKLHKKEEELNEKYKKTIK